MSIVLYTKVVGAQCVSLGMVVDRTKLATLAAVDMPSRKAIKRLQCKFVVWDKVPLFSEIPEFP